MMIMLRTHTLRLAPLWSLVLCAAACGSQGATSPRAESTGVQEEPRTTAPSDCTRHAHPSDGDCAGPPAPPPEPAAQRAWFACQQDAECVVVDLGCCDFCNGGLEVAANRDHARAVRDTYHERGCLVTTAQGSRSRSCTELFCGDERDAVCREGQCGIADRAGGFIANDLERARRWNDSPPDVP